MKKAEQTSNIREKLAQLKADYVSRLPSDLSEIESLAKQLVNGNPQEKLFLQLHAKLHKITGSAGTFGLNQLSEKTRPLEQKIKTWLNEPLEKPNGKKLNEFCSQVLELKNTLNEIKQQKTILTYTQTNPSLEKSYNIWIIDNDDLLAEELSHQIESFGYQTKIFDDLKNVNTAIKTASPDLIITGIIFEKNNKSIIDITQLIPKLKNIDIPLIFMSASDDFNTRINAARLGAEGFFIKPLDVPSLVNRIVQIFERKISPAQKVLIVDDDQHLAEHYKLVFLAAGINAEILENSRDIIHKVSTFRPELILMDLYMPDYTGPDLAGVLRQYDNWASLPIVFLSSETDLDKQISAMKHGADDFLTKPISNAQLVAAIKGRIERSRQLEAQITRDSLTGLLKHSSIKDAAESEVNRASRNKTPVSIAMLDLDHFKNVNDKYGHATGDVVICAVAMLLRQRLRQYDIIGRYGGEEYVVVLPGCDAMLTIKIMEDIRKYFSEIKFRHENEIFSCSISIGVAANNDFPGYNGSEILIVADNALYAAKEAGRNRVVNAKKLPSKG
ncbi:diguanylate cyclase [Aliikangiella sp. IMCC44359]|uniref:diguanylate cyclase n=1 Tax=Aliikangiella sp. IMCC44359 TaxID=3459125 RepID=UPI00403B07BA